MKLVIKCILVLLLTVIELGCLESTQAIVDDASDQVRQFNMTARIVDVDGKGTDAKIDKEHMKITYEAVIINTGSKNFTEIECYESKTYHSGSLFGASHTESLTENNILEPGESWTYTGYKYTTKDDIYNGFVTVVCGIVYDADPEWIGENNEINGFNAITKTIGVAPKYKFDKIPVTYTENGQKYDVVDGKNEALELVNNLSARDPTYKELLGFLRADETESNAYIPDSFVCSDFAKNMHDNAEFAGIRSGWVGIEFSDSISHACNVFNTTDRGLVYIDCTGGGKYSCDTMVDMKIGEVYKPIPVFSSRVVYEPMGTVSDYRIFW